MASAPTLPVSPRSSVDARGRLVPLSAEEQRQRVEEVNRAFDEIATIGTEEEQNATLEAPIEGLNGPDALSSRKRFRECE